MPSTVSIVKTNGTTREDIKKSIQQSLDLNGGLSHYITKNDKVLVKPNLCWGGGNIRVTTHPYVTAAIVELANEAGAGEVIVGESSGKGVDTGTVFESTGTREIAEEAGARIVDFKNDDYIELENMEKTRIESFLIPVTVMEADVRINLPVMKIDCPTTFSCSIKNWAGLLHDKQKVDVLHRRGMPWNLADLHSHVKPDLIIVDGISPPEVFPGNTSYDMGLIVTGNDPVSIDTVCSKLMGVDPEKIMNTMVGAERGIGVMDIEKIQLKGEPIESMKRVYNLPPLTAEELMKYPGFEDIEITCNVECAGCLQSLLFTWRKKLKKRHKRKLKGKHIHIGEPDNLAPDTLYLGNCNESDMGNYLQVKGCMPYSTDILRGVKALIRDDDPQR